MKTNPYEIVDQESSALKSVSADGIQGDFFSGFGAAVTDANELVGQSLPMPNASVVLYRNFFDPRTSDRLFEQLRDEINWRQDRIKIYGKEIDLPRKTAWYGDNGKSYSYSGIHLIPAPWTPTLLQVKARVEDAVDVRFNSVLLNLYRHGTDSMSWHADDEPELGQNPVIASVSFGGTRRLVFRHRHNKSLKTDVELTHGSFLLMAGDTQHFWQHQVPKTARTVAPRINLTFRVIMD